MVFFFFCFSLCRCVTYVYRRTSVRRICIVIRTIDFSRILGPQSAHPCNKFESMCSVCWVYDDVFYTLTSIDQCFLFFRFFSLLLKSYSQVPRTSLPLVPIERFLHFWILVDRFIRSTINSINCLRFSVFRVCGRNVAWWWWILLEFEEAIAFFCMRLFPLFLTGKQYVLYEYFPNKSTAHICVPTRVIFFLQKIKLKRSKFKV